MTSEAWKCPGHRAKIITPCTNRTECERRQSEDRGYVAAVNSWVDQPDVIREASREVYHDDHSGLVPVIEGKTDG